MTQKDNDNAHSEIHAYDIDKEGGKRLDGYIEQLQKLPFAERMFIVARVLEITSIERRAGLFKYLMLAADEDGNTTKPLSVIFASGSNALAINEVVGAIADRLCTVERTDGEDTPEIDAGVADLLAKAVTQQRVHVMDGADWLRRQLSDGDGRLDWLAWWRDLHRGDLSRIRALSDEWLQIVRNCAMIGLAEILVAYTAGKAGWSDDAV